MSQMTPVFPPNWDCDVVGYVYDSDDPFDLSQDMLEVSTPSGVLVTAGWNTDRERYVVDATFGFVLLASLESKDIESASVDVWELVQAYHKEKPTGLITSQADVENSVSFSKQDQFELASW